MRRRTGVIGVLAVCLAALGVRFGMQASDVPSGNPEAGSGAATTSSSRNENERWDGGPVDRTIADRRVRDELRRRIIAAWAEGEPEGATAASEGRIPPMPRGADGKIDPQYIKDIVRSDLEPMLMECYDELSKRRPGTEGRISLSFTIVGDDKIGGIVEETTLAEDAGSLADDERFTTCVRESTMSLAFRPPDFDGKVVVPLTVIMTEGDR